MKVSRINYNVPNQETKHNNGRNQKSVNNQSFKGIGAGLDTLSLGLANAIETGGLFVSFTLQDMLGTNLPRPIMGLMRNKKENQGKANKNFAAKELVREFLTGPSMFIIPAFMLAGAKKLFGNSINVPADAIKSLGNIHAAQPLNAAGQAISKQEFYQNAFSQIIKNAKGEAQVSNETITTASDFAKRLIDSASDKLKSKQAVKSIASDFVEISKKFASDPAHTDFTSAAISKDFSANIKNAVSYISAYADDVVVKAQGQDISKLEAFIKNISNKKVIGRFAMNAAMFAAVMAFLQVIPKIYNKAEGKDNAGLKGLMKEETLNDDSVQVEPQKDKSKPSFGSAASVAGALTGKGTIAKIARNMEFSGLNLSFPLLVTTMAGCVGFRIKNAKDKYDREEILRRDVISCSVLLFGQRLLEKCFSKANEAKSGFVLASKEAGFNQQNVVKRIWDYIRPMKGVHVLSTDQIISKYSNIGNYKDGFKGFCEFIEGQGGNLGKVFSLTDESKTIVDSLLQKEGKSIASADNSVIKEVLDKAKGSEEIKKLTELFKDSKNPWVTKARTLNARFTALSVLVIVPVFLGFLLPWINEKTTKRKYKEDHAEVNKPQQNTLAMLNYKPADVFKDMDNFTK